MSAVTPTTREGMVLSVSQLETQEQAAVRCIVLLGGSRLRQAWRVSDISEGADCILQRPQTGNGDSVATLELNLADGKRILFDVEWPLIEQRLVDALNRVSAHCAALPKTQTAQVNAASWMSHLISGFGRARARPAPTVTTSLAQAGADKRSAISGYLRLFGRHDTQQQTSILLVGSPGSGKTTAITTVSTSKVHSTEVEATDTVASLKPRTTIALDYGECEAEGCRIRLYGTPGQLRFAHMIRQTLATCDAVMILADATSPTPFEDVQQYVQLLEGIGNGRPIVVAYTHLDQGGMPRNLRSQLVDLLGRRVATIPLDPRDRGSVLRALSLLVNTHAADAPLPGFAHVSPTVKSA